MELFSVTVIPIESVIQDGTTEIKKKFQSHIKKRTAILTI